MAGHADKLHATRPAQLTRFEDRISFVYIDRARVVRGGTGVLVYLSDPDQGPVRVPLPAAAVAAVLLGPGTSITSPALDTLTRCGAVVLSVGVEGARTYAWAYSTSSTSRWAHAQARLWADTERRVGVATDMYLRRFDEPPPGVRSLERLRGAEGARMRELYKALAARHRVRGFRRNYDPENFEDGDPVNQALSSANACLYGVCLAAVASLGAIPQLGFVHSGTPMSFVHDIADLYKAEITVPSAFLLARSTDPAAAARRVMRREFRERKLLSRIVRDIQELLAEGLEDEQEGSRLFDGDGTVEGGRNWHRIVGSKPVPESTDEWPDDFPTGAGDS